MSKQELRERIEERSKAIYEMLFIDSMNECIEDMRLDFECLPDDLIIPDRIQGEASGPIPVAKEKE